MSGESTRALVWILSCAALPVGCNRGAAREALAEAAQEIEAVRPQLEAYAPEQLPALRAAVEEARSRLDEGRYTDALRLAQRLPGRVHDALDKGNRRKGELEAEWTALAGRLPAVLRGIGLRLNRLEQAQAPASASPGLVSFADGWARLAELERAWSQAQGSAQAARPAQAVAAARGLAAGAQTLAAQLGLSVAQAAALANAPAPAGGPPAPQP